MGLGPTVCTDCKVYADLGLESINTNGTKGRFWYCPMCGTHELGHLWEQKDQKIYDVNEKFVQFVKG